jgi:chemotaxis response regulator CheB
MRDHPRSARTKATCVVYGMPRAALEAGAVSEQLPLEKIGPEILRLCNANAVDVKHACRV